MTADITRKPLPETVADANCVGREIVDKYPTDAERLGAGSLFEHSGQLMIDLMEVLGLDEGSAHERAADFVDRGWRRVEEGKAAPDALDQLLDGSMEQEIDERLQRDFKRTEPTPQLVEVEKVVEVIQDMWRDCTSAHLPVNEYRIGGLLSYIRALAKKDGDV